MAGLLVCEHKGCINDLSQWEKEELNGGVLEIQCPGCGSLHHLFRSSNDTLYIQLVRDDG